MSKEQELLAKMDVPPCTMPLPDCFYSDRINENFLWMYFDGAMRETVCAKTGQAIVTTLPKSLDGRILSEAAYQQTIL